MTEPDIIKNYTTPSQAGSFSGLDTFFKHNSFKDREMVSRSLENLRAYTQHRSKKPEKRFRPVLVTFNREILSIDLLDITNLHRYNSFYSWMLVMVDTFSRYVWVLKLKNKKATTVAQSLNEHFSNPDNLVSKIFCDRDKSFYAKEVQQVLKKYNIEMYSTSSYKKSVFAEVYIRIIKSKLYKYFTFKKTKRWVDIIDDLVYGLNNTVNKTTGFKAVDVNEENSPQVWHNIYSKFILQKKDKPRFKEGDLIRLSTTKTIFTKKYVAQYSNEIFKIKKVYSTSPAQYQIEDLHGNTLSGRVYDFEIVKVTSTTPVDA